MCAPSLQHSPPKVRLFLLICQLGARPSVCLSVCSQGSIPQIPADSSHLAAPYVWLHSTNNKEVKLPTCESRCFCETIQLGKKEEEKKNMGIQTERSQLNSTSSQRGDEQSRQSGQEAERNAQIRRPLDRHLAANYTALFLCVETVEFAFYLHICEHESVLKQQKGCRGAACSASSLLIQCKNIQYLLKQKRVQI